jgi:hypothetical protein
VFCFLQKEVGKMAEEVKKEEKKECKCENAAPMIFKFVLGAVFFALAAYLLFGRFWWKDTWLLVKGCAGPFLVLAGIITWAIAKE